MPIRVGIVGLGQRGLQHLRVLRSLQESGRVRVVALIDAFPANLDDEKLRRYADGFSSEGVLKTTDFRAALDAAPLDALYFALPPSVHRGEVLAAAERGIPLFIEKPASLRLDELLEMSRAIDAGGSFATVGFQQRFDPACEAAQRFLADKKIVMLTMIRNHPLESHSVKHTATETLGGPANRVWTANAAWSGTTVVEAGIHQVDLMRYWAGDIAWVEATYLRRDPDDIEDGADNPYAYRVAFGFRNGAIGNLLLSRLRKVYYGDGYDSVLWTHGHLKFEGGEAVAYYYDGEYPPASPPDRDAVRHVLKRAADQDSTRLITESFLSAVETGDPSRLRNTFQSSLNSHAAVLGANISDRLEGRRIDLEELLFDPAWSEFRRQP